MGRSLKDEEYQRDVLAFKILLKQAGVNDAFISDCKPTKDSEPVEGEYCEY